MNHFTTTSKNNGKTNALNETPTIKFYFKYAFKKANGKKREKETRESIKMQCRDSSTAG